MAGERTPDTSLERERGSSDDDISLREHMQRQLDTLRQLMLRMDDDQGKYFERIIADLRDLLDERFMAQQNAVGELKTTTTQRFESVNEFRAQLNSQQQTFMGRDESISRHERTQEAIAAMGQRHENEMRVMRERFEGDVKNLRDRHDTDIAVVNSRLDLGQGKASGRGDIMGWIFAGIAAAGGLIGLAAYVGK